MNKKFLAYLNSLQASDVVINRVGNLAEIYKQVSPDRILEIFISNIINKSGDQELGNLWFLTNRYLMEAKEFLLRDNIDIATISNRIVYVEISSVKFDYISAIAESRLFIEVRSDVSFDLRNVFRAAGSNCNKLWYLYQKYIKPNLKDIPLG